MKGTFTVVNSLVQMVEQYLFKDTLKFSIAKNKAHHIKMKTVFITSSIQPRLVSLGFSCNNFSIFLYNNIENIWEVIAMNGKEMHGIKEPWWAKYAYDAPYPEVKVASRNIEYAMLLQDDYAGVVSETTAIMQYLYHHYFYEEKSRKLSRIVEGISINEMHHLEILAETILLLGGDPKYRGSYSTQCNFWNGSFVNYGTNICQQLQMDLQAELEAIETYRKHIQLISDPYVDAILERIILDEQVHMRIFREAIEKYCR